MIGQIVVHYQISGKLGVGGMDEIARDNKLMSATALGKLTTITNWTADLKK